MGGRLGLFFGCDERSTPGGPEQRFASLTFDSEPHRPWSLHFLLTCCRENEPNGLIQPPTLQQPIRLGEEGPVPLARSFGLLAGPTAFTSAALWYVGDRHFPPQWHRLAVESLGDGGWAAYWDGRRVFRQDRKKLAGLAELWWEVGTGLGRPVPTPLFLPRGPLGLIARNSRGEFRNVTLRPLPDS